MYKALFIFIFLSFSSFSQMWQIKGATIFGDNPGDYLGYDSRISGDGTAIILGSASANSGEGYSRVYGWDGSSWVQKGTDFTGQGNSLEGRALDINFDGSIIITAAYSFDSPQADGIGRVRVFQWNNTQWEQMGDALLGGIQDGWFGESVSISNDGYTIAIGETGYNNTGLNANGRVHLYSWDGTNWNEMNGSPINGINGTDNFAKDISLSEDGTSIVIGDDNYPSFGTASGLVQIFDFDGQSWSQRGDNILGQGGSFGWSVSNSADGNRIIVGAKSATYGPGTGAVHTFEWDGTAWIEIVPEIHNIAVQELGFALELNDSGDAMIVSSRSNFGKSYVYYWSGTDWIQQGQTVTGEAFGDFFGIAVDISSEGHSFITGAASSDQQGANAGASYVYEVDNLSVETISGNQSKELIRISDVTGRTISHDQTNTVLIYIYSDGTCEKRYRLNN